MPRSSRHKSHKQSKHSSKDDRGHSDSDEDVKINDRNGKEETSVRVSRDSTSGEKRKISSQARDGKDPSDHGNCDTSEEYVVSKRRKEKADGAATSDRWNAGGDERGDSVTTDKAAKGESSRLESDKSSKSKVLVDSKSRTSRRHDSVAEKEENTIAASEKDETKSTCKVDSKQKSDKDKSLYQYKDSKDSKDKERGLERERKGQDFKRDAESREVDGEIATKQGSHSMDFGEEQQGKRSKENTGWAVQDQLRNPELEKELEKRIRKRRDGSSDKDRYQDHAREIDDRRLSSRGERAKDGKYKDERHKDGSHGDKYREDGGKDYRHKDDKHEEDVNRDNKYRSDKYREDGDRGNRHRDDKYGEDGERDNKHTRDGKYWEDGDRDYKYRDGKYREEGDKDKLDSRHKDDKYHEDGDRDNRHRDDKHCEDGDRDSRHRDDKHWRDADRDNRHRDDLDRDSRHRDGRSRDDSDRDRRLRDTKYRDDRTSRDRSSDKSDVKRLRDESSAGERHRKSSNRDASPIYDERSIRYKDDKGKRRASDKEDKEDRGDIRYRSSKEQRSDTEKKSIGSTKLEPGTDRGGSYLRDADVEISLNHSRQKSSPGSSSHAAKDHYRLSKEEGLKYRDYVHEEKAWHDITSNKEFSAGVSVTERVSVTRSIERNFPKDDSHFAEVSLEIRQKSDSRASPLRMADKSPSSSTGRRRLNRSEVRRSLDIEESGQRSGGSRDTKDYSDKEGRGSRELPMDTIPVDELSQADGDTLSVSSPFSRPGRFPSNSKSLLPPPPPFRTGVDNPLAFGSLEDDNRGKSINRHRRIGDSNMGRVQGSAWKGVPNWPSPLPNGFMPFQHGPPPVGFHPMMQQFPGPPMFGVRPPMELNHGGLPYHIPDADRFSGHGRPLGWRNPADDSCPPPLHGGWDTNTTVFGDESHIYGRPDWDHNRSLMSGRGWETSGDMRKGQNGGVSAELPSGPQKQDYPAHRPVEEAWTGQSGQQAQNEQSPPGSKTQNTDINQSNDYVATNTVEAPKILHEKIPSISKSSRKDDNCVLNVYLSKLDISADLTQPDLYNQCTNLISMCHNANPDGDDSTILCEEVTGPKVAILNRTFETSNSAPFASINDSVFQKAMSLYKKQREEIKATSGKRATFCNAENLELVPTSAPQKVGSKDDQSKELNLMCDYELHEAEALESKSVLKKPEIINASEELGVSDAATNQKTDEAVESNSSKKSEEEPISAPNIVKMEVDPVLSEDRLVNNTVEDKSGPLENDELSDVRSVDKVEDVKWGSECDSRGISFADSNEEQKLVDTKCGPLQFTEQCEAVMPESVESGSVNLSRIHLSPESTH